MPTTSAMHTARISISLGLGLALALLVTACATTQKADVIPQDGPTMTELYATHVQRIGADEIDGARRTLNERLADPIPERDTQTPSVSNVRWVRELTMTDDRTTAAMRSAQVTPPPVIMVSKPRDLQNQEIDLAGYTREADHEIDSLFSRLPNPDLVMYVYPHLTGPDNTPVPGYATSFPMYERVEYALPGEAPSRAWTPSR